MPGAPLRTRFEAHIEALGGDEVVFDQIAGGATMEEVASSFRGFLDDRPDFPSRQWMYTWIHAGGEEREQAWKEAKRIAAHIHMEEAGEILENDGQAPVTSAEMSWLKERAGHKKHLAETFNSDMYGEEQQGVNVNLDIGSLHLQALRQAGRMELAPGDQEERMIETEAEVVEEESV